MKNLKTTIVIAAIFFLNINIVYSQTLNRLAFNKYKAKNLKIMFVAPLDKEGIPQIETFEKLIKEYWVLGNDFEVVSSNKITMNTRKNKKIIVAEYVSITYSTDGRTTIGKLSNQFRMTVNNMEILNVLLEEQIGDASIVYSLMVSQFMIKKRTQITKPFFFKESPKIYGSQMKKKTILVSKKYLGAETLENIKSVYPYKVKIGTEKEIEEAILNKSAKYLTINYGNYKFKDNSTSSNKVLYSPVDGKIIGFASSKFTIGNSKSGHTIKAKHFKQFLKSAKIK